MRVTEKCDVYSFGVVVLEVMMGRHPREVISSLPGAYNQNILLMDVLDQRLSPPTAETASEVVLAISLALRCTNSIPHFRPSMQHVSQKLSASRKQFQEPLESTTMYQLLDSETILN